MAVPIVRKLFNTDEYHAMIQSGILKEDDRVELIEGEILEMAPIGGRHAGCIRLLIRAFTEALGRRAVVDIQDPVQLSNISEPQPDLILLQPREDAYFGYHPKPADVLLVIEVSDSTSAYDRGIKIPLYARSGILEAWLIDLERSIVEVYRDPAAAGYQTVQVFRRGDRLALQAIPEILIPVDEIIG